MLNVYIINSIKKLNPGARGNRENTHSSKYYYNIYVTEPFFNKNLMESHHRTLHQAKENTGTEI